MQELNSITKSQIAVAKSYLQRPPQWQTSVLSKVALQMFLGWQTPLQIHFLRQEIFPLQKLKTRLLFATAI